MKEVSSHVTQIAIAVVRSSNSPGQRITHSMLDITLNLHLMLS